MQRNWVDPRDGMRWLVTTSPFGYRGKGDMNGREVTISFHRPGHTPDWTRYRLSQPVLVVGDQDLMDLLDEAQRRNGGQHPDE